MLGLRFKTFILCCQFEVPGAGDPVGPGPVSSFSMGCSKTRGTQRKGGGAPALPGLSPELGLFSLLLALGGCFVGEMNVPCRAHLPASPLPPAPPPCLLSLRVTP